MEHPIVNHLKIMHVFTKLLRIYRTLIIMNKFPVWGKFTLYFVIILSKADRY